MVCTYWPIAVSMYVVVAFGNVMPPPDQAWLSYTSSHTPHYQWPLIDPSTFARALALPLGYAPNSQAA
jgi:hypothetical protein